MNRFKTKFNEYNEKTKGLLVPLVIFILTFAIMLAFIFGPFDINLRPTPKKKLELLFSDETHKGYKFEVFKVEPTLFASNSIIIAIDGEEQLEYIYNHNDSYELCCVRDDRKRYEIQLYDEVFSFTSNFTRVWGNDRHVWNVYNEDLYFVNSRKYGDEMNERNTDYLDSEKR